MKQPWSALGGAFALLAVAFGAFGAHGLEAKLTPHLLDVFKTGAYYQMVHAIGLVLIGQRIEARRNCRLLRASAWLFSVGIVIFSGSLYVLALTGERRLGIVTPLGGLSFMAGWATYVAAEVTSDRS